LKLPTFINKIKFILRLNNKKGNEHDFEKQSSL
jgi:hypothetical protein